ASIKELKNNGAPLEIEGHNLIFDDRGFTGTVSVNYEILPLSAGNLGGWAFSVDSFSVSFVTNHLVEGGFGGKILLPIAVKENQDVDTSGIMFYSASISAKNILFN